MKIRIKSSDSFEQNYEKLFKLEKMINLEEKREYHYKDEYGNCKIIDKGDFIEIFRYGQINSKQIIKILYLPILQSNFMENMRFLQKNLKKKMEK